MSSGLPRAVDTCMFVGLIALAASVVALFLVAFVAMDLDDPDGHSSIGKANTKPAAPKPKSKSPKHSLFKLLTTRRATGAKPAQLPKATIVRR